LDVRTRKTNVAALSVFANAILVLAKVVIGVMIGSVSVISEGIHSGVDLVAALIAWFAVGTADRPADEEHPFGHGKVENISGTAEAILIFLGAGWIIYEAIMKLTGHLAQLESAQWGVAIMLVSTVINFFVSRRMFKVGRETHSVALDAEAWNHLTDVYTSAGVTGALLIVWVGRRLAGGVNLGWVDPVAAIAVAILIIKAAWNLTLRSASDLLDAGLPEQECDLIIQYVNGLKPTIQGCHHLRTRKSGSHRFIQFHVLVDGSMSVEESHRLNDQIVAGIKELLPESNVLIHIEPSEQVCP
jgi:cation diffusion facilitator family transporter